MSDYLAIPQKQIDVVYPGITQDHLQAPNAHGAQRNSRPPTIGYFARICPEKGLDRLIDALTILRRLPNMTNARVHAAGYLGAAHRQWFADLQNRIHRDGLTEAFTYVGEVDLAGKLAFLDSVDVLSVPTAYAEPKGIYILEALARHVPVVQPAHGAFPELISLTAAGLLAPPGDAQALAQQLAKLLNDPPLRQQLGSAGRRAVETSFTDDHMAAKMLTIYQDARMNDSANGASLQVRNLHKQYPTPADPLVVLTGVSLTLSAGQTMAVVGPSGSGKSTLLNILGTLDQPTTGKVRLAGVDPFLLSANDLARFRSEKIGFIFQDHHLLPQCTAIENVLIARLAIGRTRPEDILRAKELLNRVGLADRQTHLPSELSGGERQRVAIARALMNRPALLLCDEPTGNLDPKISRSIGDLLKQVAAEEKTMLVVVTHSTMLAEMFDRKMRMEDGRLVDGP
jgi:lipoprotein-releasing system ATP-binding protein